MRTKNSIYNTIASLLSSIVPAILGIVLNNMIITRYGSDINGTLATFNQLINFLTLFEGGITLATNVSLYEPYLANNKKIVNGILNATNKIYIGIGLGVSIVSIILSIIAPFFIVSSIDASTMRILLLITAMNLSTNFFFAAKYTIMFSVAQKEYMTGFLSLIFNVASQAVSIMIVFYSGNIITLRAAALIVMCLRIPAIALLFRIKFPEYGFSLEKPNYAILVKTKDVMLQKLASLVFSSTDMIIISTFISTTYASVYAIYNMIFTFIKSIIFAITLSPFNAFGQLYASGDIEKVKITNEIYQFMSIIIATILLAITNILILPFIRLYTINVSDVNYIDIVFSILFSILCFFEVISNTLGLISNSSGHFKEMKKITGVGAIVNVFLSIVLVYPFGIRGVLLGTILTYSILIPFQIVLVYRWVLQDNVRKFLSIIGFNLFLASSIYILSTKVNIYLSNYFEFVLIAFISSIFIMCIILLSNYLVFRKLFVMMIGKFRNVIFNHK